MEALVFHGYGQSAFVAHARWNTTFEKMGINATYLEAPINVTNKKGEPGRGWFTWENSDLPIYKSEKHIGIKETLEYVHNYVQKNKPRKLIIGYSQGGTFVSVFVDQYQIEYTHLIIISSYESLDKDYKVQKLPNCKILLVVGNNDETVPKDYTLNIYRSLISGDTLCPNKLDGFKDKVQIYEHNGTHAMPLDKKFIEFVKKWLSE